MMVIAAKIYIYLKILSVRVLWRNSYVSRPPDLDSVTLAILLKQSHWILYSMFQS